MLLSLATSIVDASSHNMKQSLSLLLFVLTPPLPMPLFLARRCPRHQVGDTEAC